MKKQMLKKVYAMVLAITLIGSQQCSSVLANDIAQIYSGVTQNTEIPDYDYWMAQTIMNGIDNNGNSLYSTFRSFSEPVYRQLGEYLLDDKPLVSISTAWSIYFNSEYRNQLTNMQKYVYEMLLMDYLKYDAFGEDKNKELTNSKTDFALKIYDAIGEELNDKKESYINNLPVKESKEICRRIETIYGLGEVLKGVNEGIKTTKELIDCMSEYLAVLKVKDDCVSLLKVMQEQVSVDGDFKKAISEVLNTIDGTPIDYESKKYGEYLWNKILDAGWSALEEKKGEDVKIIDIEGVSVIADYFVLASASNANQTQALVDNVEEKLFKAGYECHQKEGSMSSTWVLMDYGDVIVHVFSKEDRLFYDLERIWRDGKIVESVDEL